MKIEKNGNLNKQQKNIIYKMKIQKFNEAYRGKGINSNRKEVISEIIDCFVDQELLGYEVTGTEYHPNNETLYLELWEKENSEDNYTLKLDLSGMGIEIVKRGWNDDKEEFYDIGVVKNLDSNSVRTTKNIKKYNI